jgi:hypothetical protein
MRVKMRPEMRAMEPALKPPGKPGRASADELASVTPTEATAASISMLVLNMALSWTAGPVGNLSSAMLVARGRSGACDGQHRKADCRNFAATAQRERANESPAEKRRGSNQRSFEVSAT